MRKLSLLFLAALVAACGPRQPAGTASQPAGKSDDRPWTDTNFPSYIRRVAYFGQRADWSHNGKKILFLEKTYGDAFELDLDVNVIRGVTHHYHHNG